MTRRFVLLFIILFCGCISATEDNNLIDSDSNNDSSDHNSTVDTPDTGLTDTDNMNDTDVDACESQITTCDDVLCGFVDDGCGNPLDCGVCECDNGQPQATNCGPCNMGTLTCAPGATGEGDCLYPEILDTISCEQIYFYDPASPDEGRGTLESPFGHGKRFYEVLDLAVDTDRKLLAIMEGAGPIQDAIEVREGISIVGGFSETFAYQPDVRTTFTVDSSRGIDAFDVTIETVVANLELNLLPQSRESVAVSIAYSPKMTVRNIVARAANAGDGRDGIDGVDGTPGLRGNDGLGGLQAQGGAATCNGWYGRYGGQSIEQVCNGQTVYTATAGGGSGGLLIDVQGQGYVCNRDGRNGDGVFGGVGGEYLGDGNFRVATNGGNGLSYTGRADSGDDGSNELVLTPSGRVVPGNGAAGAMARHGFAGYGGGGGYLTGNVRGGSGGGGGTGGCGGQVGSPGQGGESSVGLIVFHSIGAVIELSEFYASNGGMGGDGSVGGEGGNGGPGGAGGSASNLASGQKGGNGGRGGDGEDAGNGGAGAGGHSFGAIDPDGVTNNGTNSFEMGTSGLGGVGESGRAASGQAADVTTDVVVM